MKSEDVQTATTRGLWEQLRTSSTVLWRTDGWWRRSGGGHPGGAVKLRPGPPAKGALKISPKCVLRSFPTFHTLEAKQRRAEARIHAGPLDQLEHSTQHSAGYKRWQELPWLISSAVRWNCFHAPAGGARGSLFLFVLPHRLPHTHTHTHHVRLNRWRTLAGISFCSLKWQLLAVWRIRTVCASGVCQVPEKTGDQEKNTAKKRHLLCAHRVLVAAEPSATFGERRQFWKDVRVFR